MAKNARRRMYTTKRLEELSTVLTDFAIVVDTVAGSLNAPSKAIKTLRLFTENLTSHREQTARREKDDARKAARPGKIRDDMTQMYDKLAKMEAELKRIESF